MRSYREIKFTAPLTEPLVSDAFIAERPKAAWRAICLPGTPCRKSLFHRILNLAPDDLEIVVLSRAGFGKGHRTAVTDFGEQSKIIEPFLGDKRTVILGMSYGGAISLAAALAYPNAIEGVVTGAALISEPFDYARALADLGKFEWANKLAPRELRHASEEIRGRRSQIGPLLDKLDGFPRPVEVQHGTLDTLVSLQDAKRLVRAIGPQAQLDILNGGTHYLAIQMPRQTLAGLKRVIERIEG